MLTLISNLFGMPLMVHSGTGGGEQALALHQFWNNITFPQCSWIILVLYVIHYGEERLLLSDWINKYCPVRGIHYTLKKLDGENTVTFGSAVIVVLLLNFAAPDNWILQAMVLGGGVGFIWNTWYHAFPTLRTRVYSPGVVTACLFNPRVSSSFF